MDRALIDLHHLGLPGAIAAYVIADPEPALIDPGPSTTFERLVEGLSEMGLSVGDLRHVVLTHVHLDHAGASGHIVRENRAVRVHVHGDGLPHMADPEKLVSSTRRTFGEAHDRLWGEVLPVPHGNLVAADQPDWKGPNQLRAFSTPGHIAHHLAYLSESLGTLFSGDAMGIVLTEHAPSHPPTPPPSLDLAAWLETLEKIEAIDPDRFGATHFGFHGRFQDRRRELARELVALRNRVADALDAGDPADAERYDEEVIDRLSAHGSADQIRTYFETFPAATDWEGMQFHLERLERKS